MNSYYKENYIVLLNAILIDRLLNSAQWGILCITEKLSETRHLYEHAC